MAAIQISALPERLVDEAYAALQFDPEDEDRMETFHNLAWSHFRSSESPRWLRAIRTGDIKLEPLETLLYSERVPFQVYSHTLESLTHNFAIKHARVLWPGLAHQRSHLTTGHPASKSWTGRVTDDALQYFRHMRPNKATIARLENRLDHQSTPHEVFVHSRIGQALLRYFRALSLCFDMQPVIVIQREHVLLERVLGEATGKSLLYTGSRDGFKTEAGGPTAIPTVYQQAERAPPWPSQRSSTASLVAIAAGALALMDNAAGESSHNTTDEYACAPHGLPSTPEFSPRSPTMSSGIAAILRRHALAQASPGVWRTTEAQLKRHVVLDESTYAPKRQRVS